MENEDFTLLAISCTNGEGLSPIQLQKSLFLLGKSGLPGLPKDFYNYIPYNYGPFCITVYDDANTLVTEGLVATARESGQSWSRYLITTQGLERAVELKEQVDDRLFTYLKEVISWIKPLSFTQLLRSIYAKYPEFRENSVFQE